jgi:hypothetical protein
VGGVGKERSESECRRRHQHPRRSRRKRRVRIKRLHRLDELPVRLRAVPAVVPQRRREIHPVLARQLREHGGREGGVIVIQIIAAHLIEKARVPAQAVSPH